MKKPVLLFFLILFTSISRIKAQTSFIKDSLSVTSFLEFDRIADFENYQVKFKKVLSDSRCPKHVMCLRAGEAKVVVTIFENGRFIENKHITIDASGYVVE